jgi:hypothetical protein
MRTSGVKITKLINPNSKALGDLALSTVADLRKHIIFFKRGKSFAFH